MCRARQAPDAEEWALIVFLHPHHAPLELAELLQTGEGRWQAGLAHAAARRRCPLEMGGGGTVAPHRAVARAVTSFLQLQVLSIDAGLLLHKAISPQLI